MFFGDIKFSCLFDNKSRFGMVLRISPCLSKILSALADKVRIAFGKSKPKKVSIIFRSPFYLSPKTTPTLYYTLIYPHS